MCFSDTFFQTRQNWHGTKASVHCCPGHCLFEIINKNELSFPNVNDRN